MLVWVRIRLSLPGFAEGRQHNHGRVGGSVGRWLGVWVGVLVSG